VTAIAENESTRNGAHMLVRVRAASLNPFDGRPLAEEFCRFWLRPFVTP